jgi:hypothetical protein
MTPALPHQWSWRHPYTTRVPTEKPDEPQIIAARRRLSASAETSHGESWAPPIAGITPGKMSSLFRTKIL